MAINPTLWIGPGQTWLQKKANKHFHAWVMSNAGEKWRKNRNKNPYQCGYSQPDWMHDAIKALGKGNEETFKYIKMLNL